MVFPTQDAMSDSVENFGMILRAGKIQFFCADTVDVETWSNVWDDKVWRVARQEKYYLYVVEEVLPFMKSKNPRLPIVTDFFFEG